MSETRLVIPPGKLIGFDKIIDFFTDTSGFGSIKVPKLKVPKMFKSKKIDNVDKPTASSSSKRFEKQNMSMLQSIANDYIAIDIIKYLNILPLIKYIKLDAILEYLNIVIFIKSLIIIVPLYLIYINFKNDMNAILNNLKTFVHLDTIANRTALLEGLKYNIGILILPIILAAVVYFASTDPRALVENTINYVVVIFVILLGVFIAFSTLLKSDSLAGHMPLIVSVAILLTMIAVQYLSSYITPRIISIASNSLKIVVLLMLIVGLAIAYKFYSSQLKALTGWKGFFINFLFYIPCLFSDGLEYLLHQYNITPNIVFVLLMIELLLALVYVYIPKMLKKSMKKTEILLLNKPMFLNTEMIVGKPEMFLFKPIDDYVVKSTTISEIELFRRNYSINMWVFLNAHSSSNSAYKNETNIFDYNMHPRVTYKNESDNERSKDKGVYTFYFSNVVSTAENPVDDSKYELSLPNQKWNLITFNYFDTKADLYINGNLERTFIFSNNIPRYEITDLVKLGQDDGLNGAICNVSYNKKPLSSTEIATFYNIHYMNNPPISFNE